MAKMSQEAKLTAQFWLAVAVVVAGVALIFMGFLVPPPGEIDNSVLVAYGETLTFAGSLIGVDYHYRAKSASGDSAAKKTENDG
jgi:drug/metabolite transporter (DMT)-like permease